MKEDELNFLTMKIIFYKWFNFNGKITALSGFLFIGTHCITKHNKKVSSPYTTPYHFFTAIVGINSPSLDCSGTPYIGTFSVKSIEVSIKSCLSDHTLKTKWTHLKHHKIKVIATVYWESVKFIILSTEWIYHAADDPWPPCLTYCIQYFMFDGVQVKEDMLTTIQISLK